MVLFLRNFKIVNLKNKMMRMIAKISCPVEPFNTLIREGKAGALIEKILGDIKPEAAYFTEMEGCRTALLVVNVTDASDIPAIAEPWFLNFDADCEFKIAMTPDDLKNAGLEELGQKWRFANI